MRLVAVGKIMGSLKSAQNFPALRWSTASTVVGRGRKYPARHSLQILQRRISSLPGQQARRWFLVLLEGCARD